MGYRLNGVKPVFSRIFLMTLTGWITSCTLYPRVVNYPFEPGGGGLNSPSAELTPQMSRRYIVFTSDRRGRQNIYLYDTQTRKRFDLPGLNALNAIASEPAISAEGRYIVFVATRGERSDIYFYNRETRQLKNLTQNLNAQVRHPTISANGTVIAFESSARGQWDILLYNRYGQPLNVPTSSQ